MTFEDALEQIRLGRAVSRSAWGDPHILVRLAKHVRAAGKRTAVLTPRHLDDEDLAADDWFSVGMLN